MAFSISSFGSDSVNLLANYQDKWKREGAVTGQKWRVELKADDWVLTKNAQTILGPLTVAVAQELDRKSVV